LLWQNAANFAPKRRGTSPAPANAVRIRNARDDIDVVELLPRVQLPTLVLRCRHDNGGPFEQHRLLARSIARAKFMTLESDNHVVLAGEPAWPRLISELAAFLIAAFLAE
jgi:pimeloyl-ACP methyl ester carboxylesterase